VTFLLTGRVPYRSKASYDTELQDESAADIHSFNVKNLLNGPDGGFFSAGAKDFLEKCLQANPQDRATAVELLNHYWVREMEVERLDHVRLQ